MVKLEEIYTKSKKELLDLLRELELPCYSQRFGNIAILIDYYRSKNLLEFYNYDYTTDIKKDVRNTTRSIGAIISTSVARIFRL